MTWAPAPAPPERKTGHGWDTVATLPQRPVVGGWYALLEKLAPLDGLGRLAGLTAPHYALAARLDAEGDLGGVMAPRRFCVAAWSGLGLPTATTGEIRTGVHAYFTGNGQYDALSINDGLTATIQPGYAVNFRGGGELLGGVEGGIQYPDGLSANAIERYLFPAYFTGVGQLLGWAGETSVAMAYLIGTGSLTTDNPKQIYPLMAALAGNGTLSAPAFATYQKLVNLLGTGQLSATLFANFLAAAGFQGAGAFTALLLASYARPSVGGGVGTVSALTLQRYTLGGATPAPTFTPTDLTGCTVWLDASQLGLAADTPLGSAWPNLGSGGDGMVVATPAPAVKMNAPNGKPVVSFKVNEGRIRGDGMIPSSTSDLTVIYVGHMRAGGSAGRIFTGLYPEEANFLVGTHQSGRNNCYDNGWVGPTGNWIEPYDMWTTWGYTYTAAGNLGTFYVDGVEWGTGTNSSGHGSHWNISGYSATGTEETCDCEVAEMVTYDRALTPAERVQVENYLHAKWFEEAVAPTGGGVPLSGNGSLRGSIEGVINVEEIDAYFDGDGELDAEAYGVMNEMFAILDGRGTLTAAMLKVEQRAATLAGRGTMSATAAHHFLLGLLADGSLTADTYMIYARAAGFTGPGALAALTWALRQQDSVSSGDGTVSATVSQKYPMAVNFSGGGALGGLAFDFTYPDGLSARVSIIYGAFPSGSGTLTATTQIYQLRSTPALTGSGALSATVSVVQLDNRSAALSGSGTLSAVIIVNAMVNTGFGDDFNRVDDLAQIGNGWITRTGTMGTYLNGVVPVTASVWNDATAPVVMNSDDMEVSFTAGQFIGTPSAGDYVAILLGLNTSGEGLFVFVNGGAGITIYSQTGWGAGGLVAQGSIGIGQIAGDKWTAKRVGNTYTILKNGAGVGLSWIDSANIIPRDVNHRQVGLAAYTDGANARVIEDFTAVDTGSLRGNGALSASYTWSYNFLFNTVSPASGAYDTTITLTGAGFSAGISSVTIGGQAVRNLTVVNDTTITCTPPGLANGTYNVVVTSTSAGSLTKTSAFAYSFTQVNQENAAYTNAAVPTGSRGCWVTLIGAGGGGGKGFFSTASARGGGGGAGGGAKINRVFVDRSLIGSTYTVARPLGAAASTVGSAATFVSGSVNLSAGGGGRGGDGTTSAAGTAGTGGVATASGVSATLLNGTAGGLGGSADGGAGAAAANNATGSAPGGGGGSGFGSLAANSTGGAGGNSATVSGGATRAVNTGNGNPGANAAAGNAGGGGSGSARLNSFTNTGTIGGAGGDYGGGGGGALGSNSSGTPGAGGPGGDSYTLLEWV